MPAKNIVAKTSSVDPFYRDRLMLVRDLTKYSIALFVAVSGVGVGATSLADPQPVGFERCSLPDVEVSARCATITVPENWQTPDGRKIPIHIAVVPARSPTPKDDPIVILMGGPGESAIEDASVYARWLAPVLDDRDLLLVDQRGAGSSAPLKCPIGSRDDPAPLLADSFPPTAVEACVAKLSRTADLTKYGFSDFARDLDHIRTRLGYGRLNLFAGSYGTRAAQVFLRAYPKSVRTAYLGSVVPIDIIAPLTMAKTAQVEMERLFDDCAADQQCNQSYPQLRLEFDAVMRQLDDGKARLISSDGGGELVLRTAPAVAWFRAKLYRPSSAAILPWAIHSAYQGDWRAVSEGILASSESTFSFGLFFAITCNEDVRFIAQGKIEPETRDTFLGPSRVLQQQAGCRFWPSSPLPKGYRDPVHTSIPTLFVTGEADGGTPTWFTDHAARAFTNAAVVLAPGQGHTEWSACIAARYFGLVRDGQLRGPRRERCAMVPRPPFKTR